MLTQIIKRWGNEIDAVLGRFGLPLHITGGNMLPDGRVIFEAPAPQTEATREMARLLGVSAVRFTLQVEVIPFVVVGG